MSRDFRLTPRGALAEILAAEGELAPLPDAHPEPVVFDPLPPIRLPEPDWRDGARVHPIGDTDGAA